MKKVEYRINFNLKKVWEIKPTKKDNSDGVYLNEETPIIMSVTWNKKRLRYYTGKTILPKHFDNEIQEAKDSFLFNTVINSKLNDFYNITVKIFSKYKINEEREPTVEELKEKLDEEFKPDSSNESKKEVETFVGYFKDYTERLKPKVKYRVHRNYLTTLGLLHEFSKSTGRPLEFDTITLRFYDKFVEWLKEKYAVNTVSNHIRNLKAVLRSATDDGYNSNLAFQNKKFKKISEEVDSIYLSVKELKALEELDLSATPHLDRVRDRFLIGCWTGLRYGDYSKLCKENIKGNDFHVKQEKTGDRVIIPIVPVVRRILEKYNYDLPKPISGEKFNEYIKLVGKKVPELEVLVKHRIREGGSSKIEMIPKYNAISSHVARRSYCTNAFLAELPVIAIRAISGHKTESAFLKYIRASQRETADLTRNKLMEIGK